MTPPADLRYQAALLDPVAVFDRPRDVLSDPEFSDGQKIEILRRWNYDAREISVAEDEGMPAGDEPLLSEILQALDRLGVHPESRRAPPTKQGGVDPADLAGGGSGGARE